MLSLLPAQMGVCVSDAWVLTCISLVSKPGTFPSSQMGVRSLSLPFILVHILYNVGLHSYPVGGQEAPSCGLLLYEAGTDSALCVVGFVSFRMEIQHHVDTLVSTPHCNGPRCCDHGGPRS